MKTAAKALILSLSLFLAYSAGVLLLGSLKEKNTINTVIVEINYFGNWNATITNGEELVKSGFGKTEHIFSNPLVDEWTLSIRANKLDDSYQKLKIIVKLVDGTVLGSASTSESFGHTSLIVEIII